MSREEDGKSWALHGAVDPGEHHSRAPTVQGDGSGQCGGLGDGGKEGWVGD